MNLETFEEVTGKISPSIRKKIFSQCKTLENNGGCECFRLHKNKTWEVLKYQNWYRKILKY